MKELIIKNQDHSSPHHNQNDQHDDHDHHDHQMVHLDNSEYNQWTGFDHHTGAKGNPSNDQDVHSEGTHHKEIYDSRGFGIRHHGGSTSAMNDNLEHSHKVELSHGELLRYKNNIHKFHHEMMLHKKPKRSHIPKHMVIVRNSKPSASMHILKIKPIYTMNDGSKVIVRPLRSHKPIHSPSPVSHTHSASNSPPHIKETNGPINTMFDGGSSTDTFSSMNFGNYDSGHIMFEGSFKDHFKDHLKMFEQQSHTTDIPINDKLRKKYPKIRNHKTPEISNNNNYLLNKNKFKKEVLLKKKPNHLSYHKFNPQIHHELSHKPNLSNEFINYRPEAQVANDLIKGTNRPISNINELPNIHSPAPEKEKSNHFFENTGELTHSSAQPNFSNQNQQEISTLKTTYSAEDISPQSYSNSHPTNIDQSNNENQHFLNINFQNNGEQSGSKHLTPHEDSKTQQFSQGLPQLEILNNYGKEISRPMQDNVQNFFENNLKTFPSLTTHSSLNEGSNSHFSNTNTNYFSQPNHFENVKFPQNDNVESFKANNAVNFNSGSQQVTTHSHTINHNGESGPTSYTSFRNGDAISESSSIEANKNKHGGYSIPSGSHFPNPGYSYFQNRPSYEVREEAKDDSLTLFSSFHDLPKLKVNNSTSNSLSFMNLDTNVGSFAEPLGPLTPTFGSAQFSLNSFQRKNLNMDSENVLTS